MGNQFLYLGVSKEDEGTFESVPMLMLMFFFQKKNDELPRDTRGRGPNL